MPYKDPKKQQEYQQGYYLERKETGARKKSSTSPEVIKRYCDKTYKTLAVRLRYDTDGDIIDTIEAMRQTGLETTEIFRQLLRKAIGRAE